MKFSKTWWKHCNSSNTIKQARSTLKFHNFTLQKAQIKYFLTLIMFSSPYSRLTHVSPIYLWLKSSLLWLPLSIKIMLGGLNGLKRPPLKNVLKKYDVFWWLKGTWHVTCGYYREKKNWWGLKIQWEEHLVGEGQASSGKKSL